ncbi:hypothetical protein SAMN04489761_2749 [Tenacibaculum sp. MAR_2009_124]|uniref:hypothetical protein n=1 Tax=Tenacibaculum sp. MAR_2009_124 TaxID=1250059 RepID=UPI00089471DC|nr:hypothetical protein [Tenacibaculum sp. MAR_2009_124]SEC35084.1 hypothetical protein SAMN04489761_2749 [Tenacibaculum sp. MAR_2009_124]
MELTNQQIDQLYEFTRKHYVEHYDLRTELVDHLANDIENIRKEDKNLSFKKALDISFKKFGVFGFMNIVEQKQNQLTKKYVNILINFTKQWFQLPKIILTIAGIFIFYKIQEFKNSYNIYFGSLFFLLIIQSIMMIVNKQKLKKKHKISGKKWMLEEILQVQGVVNFSFLLLNLSQFFSIGSKNFVHTSEPIRVLLAFFMVAAIILTFIALYLIPKKSEELLKKHYPEYELELT